MRHLPWSALVASSLLVGASVADDIPSVPASVLGTSSERQPVASEQSPTSESDAAPTNVENMPDRVDSLEEYTAESGITQIITISRGHLNRIVTPFDRPVVDMAEGQASVNIQDNVILFGTGTTSPITLYIREHGQQDVSINLVFYPQAVPPKEIRLSLGESYQPTLSTQRRPAAERWERSQPYQTTILELFTKIATGDIPTGYQIIDTLSDPSATLPACRQEDFAFDFVHGQSVKGDRLSVMIGVAQNLASVPQEFIESSCDNWNVAAVAAWPRVKLEPGERTEVYVAIRENRQQPRQERRPSLLRQPAGHGGE